MPHPTPGPHAGGQWDRARAWPLGKTLAGGDPPGGLYGYGHRVWQSVNVRDGPGLMRLWEARVPPEPCATAGPAGGLLSRVGVLASVGQGMHCSPNTKAHRRGQTCPRAIILTAERGPRGNLVLGRRRPAAGLGNARPSVKTFRGSLSHHQNEFGEQGGVGVATCEEGDAWSRPHSETSNENQSLASARTPQQSSLCPSSLGNVLSFKTGGSSASAPPPPPSRPYSENGCSPSPGWESREGHPTHAGSQACSAAR